MVGDFDSAPLEQRIAVLEQNHLRWVSPANLFVYEYDWTPDGRGFVGTAAPGDGDKNWWVARLCAFDREGVQPRVLYWPDSAQQQLAMPKVSRDGKRVAFIAGLMSDFGVTGGDVYTVPLLGGAATAPASRVLWQGQEFIGPARAYSAADCPASTVALVHQTFNQPAEIAIGTIGKWHDLTQANAGLATEFKVQSLGWKSGQFSVQGWLILPEAASAGSRPPGSRPPLITVVHGGPASAFEPRFIGASPWHALLAHGYALFMPNPRGSYGEGEAFVAANVRDFGHGDLDDILAGVDAVAALGLTDPERVGITGHSYGGFMTMWAVTQTDRFKAAVAGAGISNWQSYYGQNGIDEWMVPFFGASVYDDPAVYARSSPINFIRQVRTPTFSYVGAADPSVNFQAQSTAITSTGMNAAKTQNAATLAALNEMPSASPEELATMPAAAVPTAEPIRWIVEGDAAASACSPACETRTNRCTMAGQKRPNPRPCSSAHTMIPVREPAGTASAKAAAPSATNPAPPRINSLSADNGAADTASVARLQARAWAASTYPENSGLVPKRILRISGP